MSAHGLIVVEDSKVGKLHPFHGQPCSKANVAVGKLQLFRGQFCSITNLSSLGS